LNGLLQKAHGLGLTHPRSKRRLFKSELHRLLQNPIYYGNFNWDGSHYKGSHEPLITRALFDQVQDVFRGRPRARYPKQLHPFMGLLTCAKCGCAITAERKKGKYVYYHCTDYHGGCDNTYIREERLGELLGDVIKPIQITPEIAEDIATALQASETDAERHRNDAVRQLEQRRRGIVARWIAPMTISSTVVSLKSSGPANRRRGRPNWG